MGELIPEQGEGAGFKGVGEMFFFNTKLTNRIQPVLVQIVQYSCGCQGGQCRNCRARKLASMDSLLLICLFVSIDKKGILESFVTG